MLLLFVSIDIVTICSAKLRIVYHFLFVHQSIRVFVNARIWTSRLFLSNPEGSNISVSAVFHNCQHFCCDCCLFAKRNIDKNILPITNNINHYYRSYILRFFRLSLKNIDMYLISYGLTQHFYTGTHTGHTHKYAHYF